METSKCEYQHIEMIQQIHNSHYTIDAIAQSVQFNGKPITVRYSLRRIYEKIGKAYT